jgi:apolipoprotein D and lipocalin family protein
MQLYFKFGLLLSACLGLFGCQSLSKPPLDTVDYVNIERFMGDWYVIANIPTFIEEQAYNAVESYSLNNDGTIATTFTFREGSFDGELKTYHPKGFVENTETNAVWGMQFVWPIKADYRIVYLTEDYSQVIIGRNKRDYVWIMARTPQIPAEDYQHMLKLIAAMGYDTSKVRKVPQQSLENRE